jgi:hypothetical protein
MTKVSWLSNFKKIPSDLRNFTDLSFPLIKINLLAFENHYLISNHNVYQVSQKTHEIILVASDTHRQMFVVKKLTL